MNTETIKELTTSLIALILIGGGLYVLITQPNSPALPVVTSLMGGAAGYYLHSRATTSAVNTVLMAQGRTP